MHFPPPISVTTFWLSGVALGFATITCATLLANGGPANGDIMEEDGLVVIEAESLLTASPWTRSTQFESFSGEGYLLAESSSKKGGAGQMRYPLFISETGDYQLQMRSRIAEGDSATDANDSFFRIVDKEGRPVPPISNELEVAESWCKAYMNVLHRWTYDTSNRNSDPHALVWKLEGGKHYSLEMTVRSSGHAVDRLVLWDRSRYDFADKKTGKICHEAALDALPPSKTFAAGEGIVASRSREPN